MRRAIQMVALTSVVAVGALCPQTAEACGGFFCNSMPVNQAGEKIVFSQEPDGTMTTHVQILYSGTAESFAWILPVPSLPELAVGTDLLFSALDSATEPRFQQRFRTDGTCRGVPSCPRPPRPDPSEGPWYSDASASAADAGAAAPPPDVSVHFRDAVGPYDAAVLSSDDADALRTWLADNGYDIPPASLPLMDDYVASGNFFVALKLLSDRSTGEIAPIVLRYREEQPCIPIKLTAIATVPDMPITAWVLGRTRSVPYNYMDVRPDIEVRELYTGYARPNLYRDLVSTAVDDAGGRGFVTEYAGAPPTITIAAADVEDLRAEEDPSAFLMRLAERRFNGDAQLFGLLMRFIPPPEGADPRDFYNCLAQEWCGEFDGYLATLPFDPSAFVDEINAAIVHPRRDAQAMVARHPKLTRLFTTMSADEMTEDPIFVFRSSAPDISNVHIASLVTECSAEFFAFAAPQHMEYESGREEEVRSGVPYPGTDSAYCEDLGRGWFGPGVATSRLEETAERRLTHPDGEPHHGLCAIGPMNAGGGSLLFMLGGALLVLRRRRSRP